MRSCFVLQLAMIVVLGGCQEEGPAVTRVSGKISYQGKGLSQGVIQFQPMTPSAGRPAVGEIASDGTYEMSAFPNRQGILPGDYRVTIDAHTGSYINRDVKYIAPKRYVDPNTSDLTAKVPPGSESITCNFSLTD